LKQALDIAMPDRMYMPFVENCDYIKPLLEQFYREGLYRDDLPRILELAATYLEAAVAIKEHFNGEKPELTKRELEIAQLAAAGLTNKAIGARLFISENTVKTQLKSIFEKLGIKSRSLLNQALQRLS
jgi:LuxR family maltose regulon positive regulatory protein